MDVRMRTVNKTGAALLPRMEKYQRYSWTGQDRWAGACWGGGGGGGGCGGRVGDGGGWDDRRAGGGGYGGGGFELTQTRQHTRGEISRSLFSIDGGTLAANTLGRRAVCHTVRR